MQFFILHSVSSSVYESNFFNMIWHYFPSLVEYFIYISKKLPLVIMNQMLLMTKLLCIHLLAKTFCCVIFIPVMLLWLCSLTQLLNESIFTNLLLYFEITFVIRSAFCKENFHHSDYLNPLLFVSSSLQFFIFTKCYVLPFSMFKFVYTQRIQGFI